MWAKLIRAVLRFYPFYSGCGTISNQRILQLATANKKKLATPLRNGYKAVIDPCEFLGRSIYYTGEWDPKITWACKKILRDGDVFLDIGAHCGISSLYASKFVGPNGAVHSFEPQPTLAGMLRESIQLNNISNIQVHEVALSQHDGTATLHIQGNRPILASLTRSASGATIEVSTKDAGTYLQELDLEAIRLIKIDVEGHEPTILTAALEFLSQTTPDAVLFESIDREGPFRRRETVNILERLGYSFFALPKSMVRMRAVEVGKEADKDWHDFVAVSANAMPALARSLM